MGMHIVEFEERLEIHLRDVVLRHFPLDWKEDAITHALLILIRKEFGHISLWGLRWKLAIEWEIYKLHGRRESTYGDVGVLIRYAMPGGGIVEGAGFMEAKIRGRETNRFLHVRPEQVVRILARSPLTRLLLYDYNPVSVLDPSNDDDSSWHFYPSRFRRTPPDRAAVSHGPVLPLQLAAAVSQYDDTLYRFAHAFSYQFVHRYFQLHDLDFSESAVSAVKGFSTELGSPNVVMVIRAAAEGQQLPEPFQPNSNLYGVFE